MFTGIIEAVGSIQKITSKGKDIVLTIDSGKLDLSDAKLGDSIATNGACLTIVELTVNGYIADLSTETLQRTAFVHYKSGQKVNLEKAMLPTTRFGGHIVSGHVDGLAIIMSQLQIGRAIELWLETSASLAKYLAEKGSVTVDGISLTINEVEGACFKLTIVPYTALETTISVLKVGQFVNIEVDVIARYLERLVMGDRAVQRTDVGGLTLEKHAESGFLR
ncbi:riboflavin synthase [Candidatus Enterovibrio escicola]|uniref:Riboflavin synthase n=1 Tax=Candidatus Enterovibrio escicola TaxID=1927127 RepID=A0A2A5SZW9_9GAMM|nr:riboflavin synthase [Candidatus Enterovibrio escacola]PCS21452.1 Riboflavin synthase eubacterial/eukaryotic [Candidatus Enterovibrio escacola]